MKSLKTTAAVASALYLALDVLLVVSNAVVFSHFNISMIAGDFFGIAACVIASGLACRKGEPKLHAVCSIPFALGLDHFVMLLPALLHLGTAADRAVRVSWVTDIAIGFLWLMVASTYFVPKVKPKRRAILYALPVIAALLLGTVTLPPAMVWHFASPFSVNLWTLAVHLNVYKTVLPIVAGVLLTLAQGLHAKPQGSTEPTVYYQPNKSDFT